MTSGLSTKNWSSVGFHQRCICGVFINDFHIFLCIRNPLFVCRVVCHFVHVHAFDGLSLYNWKEEMRVSTLPDKFITNYLFFPVKIMQYIWTNLVQIVLGGENHPFFYCFTYAE